MKRSQVISIMQGWLGVAEPNHKFIIDIYNDYFPAHGLNYPRGYKVRYTDAWCATTVSAALIVAADGSEVIDGQLECGCEEMINLYAKKGQWIEDDSYIPKPGDIIFYDWDDSSDYAYSDNRGHADHVGIVEECNDHEMVVIEGNNNNAVRQRVKAINSRYIRGYAVPTYEEEIPPAPVPVPQPDIIPPALNPDEDAVYRLYDPTSGQHFYTSSVDEGNNCIHSGWYNEGCVWISPRSSRTPVYRLCNPNNGFHMYTVKDDEKQILIDNGWKLEGAAFCSDDSKDFPIYRLYSPAGDHLFTSSVDECESLIRLSWEFEGVAFYAKRLL